MRRLSPYNGVALKRWRQKRKTMKRKIKDFCKKHKPANKTMSYLAHHEWMERKIKQGHKQYECPKCGKWLFKCEI
jgi:predicted KAP-like P-loop ATPase